MNDSVAASAVLETECPATDARVRPRVPATPDPILELNTSAVFQLLVAATSPAVREAAAEALWPRRFADECEIECNNSLFGELAFPERVLALLVASVIDRNPRSAAKLGVVPLYHFDTPESAQGPCSVFRIQSGRAAREIVDPHGIKRRLTRNAAFTVPGSAYGTVMRCGDWGTREAEPYDLEYRWKVDGYGVHLDISSRARSRALATGIRPVVVSATGELLSEVGADLSQLFSTARLSLDSGLVLRLASGGLAGAAICFGNQLPIVRGRRPRDATLSIEIGPSIESPLIGSFFKGDLSPRYDIAGVVGGARLRMPSLGGATIAELDAIARKVGVWQGQRIRGSFGYHPLRTPARGVD